MTTATALLNRALLNMAARGEHPRCGNPVDHNLWTSDINATDK
jgi:hypothetical protein